jgi:hypothetical protein
MEEFDAESKQPTGTIKYEKFSTRAPNNGSGSSTSDPSQVLDAEKRGIESLLATRYKNTKINISKKDEDTGETIYETEIDPETKKTVIKREIDPETNTSRPVPVIEKTEAADLRKVLIGEHKPYNQDVDVERWLKLIGQSEALARANGIAYTPAAALAWNKLYPDKPYPEWIKELLDQKPLVAGKKEYRKSAKGGVTAPEQKTTKKIARTGKDKTTGRKVIQYEDGTVEYAD